MDRFTKCNGLEGGTTAKTTINQIFQYWLRISTSPSALWYSLTLFAVSSDVGSCIGFFGLSVVIFDTFLGLF